MNYKGYIGKAEYDEENHIFSGEVINTRSVVTFQGESVKELEEAFKDSVDDYIDWCEQDGVEPEKPYSGKFNVRFQPELHQKVAIAAKVMGVSLNAFIVQAVTNELKMVKVK